MELTGLGYDEWFDMHAADQLVEGDAVARVTAVDKGAYLIQGQDIDGHAETP